MKREAKLVPQCSRVPFLCPHFDSALLVWSINIPKKLNPQLKARRWSCCVTSKTWVSIVRGLRSWFTRQVGREKEHKCWAELPQVSEVNKHTHTHRGRDGWQRMQIPVSAAGYQEKLVPRVKVLWKSKGLTKKIFSVWQNRMFCFAIDVYFKYAKKLVWKKKGEIEYHELWQWLLHRRQNMVRRKRLSRFDHQESLFQSEASWVEPLVNSELITAVKRCQAAHV